MPTSSAESSDVHLESSIHAGSADDGMVRCEELTLIIEGDRSHGGGQYPVRKFTLVGTSGIV